MSIPESRTRPGARIGLVLQTTGGHDELTVEELLRHFAGYYPDSRDPDEVMRAVGLDEKRRTRSRHLSGGQRRRLDVALGILGRPDLLFLDEPITGFDRRHAGSSGVSSTPSPTAGRRSF